MSTIKLKTTPQKKTVYKNSGIEWIGKIPEDWRTARAKTFIKKQTPGVWGEEPKGDANDLPCLRVADFDYGRLSFSKVETIRNIPREQHVRILKNKSTLIERSGGGEKQPVGRAIFFESDQKMVCANFIDSIEVNEFVAPKYFTYLLAATYSIGLNLKSIKQSTGIQNLDTYSYFSEVFPQPAKNVQEEIVEYLDSKISTIDHAIEQKRKLIDLLKEKRTAIINRAVTRGLDENVELVDSGVEWIGKMPKGWKMRKIAQSFNLLGSGSTPASGNESFYEDGEINWIITGDLNDGIIYEASKKITKEAFASSSALKIYPRGTLLIAMYGATIGKVALIDIPACTNQACCALGDSPYFENKFVYYWFLINRKNIVDIYSYGSGQPNISQDTIKRLHIPAPSRDEQQKVVAFLDNKMDAIDRLISKVENSIELLTEYRTSLISHVVTGKVEI